MPRMPDAVEIGHSAPDERRHRLVEPGLDPAGSRRPAALPCEPPVGCRGGLAACRYSPTTAWYTRLRDNCCTSLMAPPLFWIIPTNVRSSSGSTQNQVPAMPIQ